MISNKCCDYVFWFKLKYNISYLLFILKIHFYFILILRVILLSAFPLPIHSKKGFCPFVRCFFLNYRLHYASVVGIKVFVTLFGYVAFFMIKKNLIPIENKTTDSNKLKQRELMILCDPF